MEILNSKAEIIVQRYRIEKVIGQGSSGITYQATDLQSRQLVAVKALSLHRAAEWKKIEMFEREARVLSTLNHPGIPSYIDYFHVDTDTDRYFYIVQQLAQGQSLATLVQNGWHPTEKEVRRISNQILEILVYLHSLNPPVIHRDIQPQNIILRPFHTATPFWGQNKATGCWGDVFLVDFGAVQNAYYNTFMRGSTVVGTYGYMAPEQFIGSSVPATDLYGLGATLLFLLTHRSPADLPTDNLKIDFRSRIQVSEEFTDWLEKMLQPDLDERFQSAKEALEVRRNNPMLIMRSNPSTKWKNFVKLGIATVASAMVLNHFKYPILSHIGLTPIAVQEAVKKGDLETVQYYFDRGVNAHVKLGDWSLLHWASSKKMVELLISKGVNVNAKTYLGCTPLYMASMLDHLEAVETLIAAGADVNTKLKRNYSKQHFPFMLPFFYYYSLDATPLHVAKSPQMARLLISKGADINAKTKKGETPLHTAKTKEVAKQLLALGAKIDIQEDNARSYKGIALLHKAVQLDFKEMLELLINKGANVVIRDIRGKTPLHYATSKTVASLLITDVNVRDNDGFTPLHDAIQNENEEVAALLISKGANVNVQNNYGNTPLHLAASNNKNKDVATLLIAKGANVNVQDNDGNTPLHLAVWNNNKNLVHLLIAKGANINLKNNNSGTPLSLVGTLWQFNKEELEKLLIAGGAKK